MLYFLAMTHCTNAQTERDNFLAYQVQIFQHTPAFDLAKAVEADDSVKIIKYISADPSLIGFQEPKFGQTLLNWAVYTYHYNAAKVLIEHGANPNTQDYYGTSAMMNAAHNFKTDAYLKLLIRHNGDVNAITKSNAQQLKTPLIAAALCRLENVKLLVDAGADINYVHRDGTSALFEATATDQIDIVRYLIVEKGARVNGISPKGVMAFDIKHMLQRKFDQDISQERMRQEVVAYLQAHPEQ